MSERVAIGIDLGTTYSCVAVYRDGHVSVIHNDKGSNITPSYVAFSDEDRYIGDSAKEQIPDNPENTVFQVKKMIGLRYSNDVIQQNLNLWPFNVIERNDAPYIKVNYLGKEKEFAPEEISAIVLSKMKKIAQEYLGVSVRDSVITVPAYFTDSQRQATSDAAKIAGLNVLKIINEPTAAALAYGIDKKFRTKCNVLVFDLGGGTFDVSILKLKDKQFEVLGVGGDTNLGGEDFDNMLLEHFLKLIKRRYNKDISTDKRAVGRLRAECEKVKRRLSINSSEKIYIDSLFDGRDLNEPLTKARFEDLCMPLFRKTIEIVKNTLVDAEVEKNDIDVILLVGGSTRIPKVREMLSKFFDNRQLTCNIHPDEAVAQGAAIQAAIKTGNHTIEEFALLDVIPLSLSVGDPDGTVTVILKKNSRTPLSHTIRRTTMYDYQETVKFSIYEGERTLRAHNKLLGEFTLEKIQRAMRGVPNIELTYTVDENGILHASACDTTMGTESSITIIENKGRLEKREIEQMEKMAKIMDENDDKKEDCLKLRDTLESLCFEQKMKFGASLEVKDDVSEVLGMCTDTLEWLEDHTEASYDDLNTKLLCLQQAIENIGKNKARSFFNW